MKSSGSSRRPAQLEREVLEEARLDPEVGLVGDTWCERPSSSSADGGPHPEKQLTLMNVRVIRFLAGEDRASWSIAGDQFYVDFDLSHANLPIGSNLEIGTARIEVTAAPHRGCAKFAQRFGKDAFAFGRSAEGLAARARGMNARVVRAGVVRRGDRLRKVSVGEG